MFRFSKALLAGTLLLMVGGFVSYTLAANNLILASANANPNAGVNSSDKNNLCAREGFDEASCFNCHKKEGWLEMRYVHGPLGMGQCAPCHKQDNNSLASKFKTEPKELCFYCHEEEQAVSEHLTKLPAKTQKCLYCHNPHASEKKYFLR